MIRADTPKQRHCHILLQTLLRYITIQNDTCPEEVVCGTAVSLLAKRMRYDTDTHVILTRYAQGPPLSYGTRTSLPIRS